MLTISSIIVSILAAGSAGLMSTRQPRSVPATNMSVSDSMAAYLDGVRLSRSPNTARTYGNALAAFGEMLRRGPGDPASLRCSTAQERWIGDFASYLKRSAPATERLYLAA